jgi:O-acetylserine/cysteine efflux transporter
MAANMKRTDVILAVAVPTIWGIGYTLTKAAFEQFPPILLMGLAQSVAALALIWFSKLSWSYTSQLFVIAAIGVAVPNSLSFTGLSKLYASTAVIVEQLEVPFAAILAWLFLNDPLSLRQILGMGLTFTGIVFIVGEPRLQQDMIPLLLVMGGAFTWAVGQILAKSVAHLGSITVTAWVSFFGALQLFIASFIIEKDQFNAIATADGFTWGIVVYLGLIAYAVAYIIWYYLLDKYQVNQVIPFTMLLPVTSVIGSVLFLGERLTPLAIIGSAIVIIGIGNMVIEKRRI